MKTLKLSLIVCLLALMGCQNEPADKKVPFVEKKEVNKKLQDVSFNPALDILFIVDDSISMKKYQYNLAKNADLFIEDFFNTKFIDFHIGVTSSSFRYDSGSLASEGHLNKIGGISYVDRNTVNGQKILSNMVLIGLNGSTSEEFLSIPTLTFSQQLMSTVNAGFYRDYAKLAVFVITDAEDQSRYTAQEAHDWLVDLKGGRENDIFFFATILASSLGPNPPGCNRDGFESPLKIEEMVQLFKDRGEQFDLCAADYGKDMAKVAESLVRAVSTIYLQELPDLETMSVTYGDIVIPNSHTNGWVYNPEDNSIVLSRDIEIEDSTPRELKINFKAIY